MARKKGSDDLRSANLSPDAMHAAIPPLEARLKELRELDTESISAGDDPRVQSLSARIASTLSRIYGEGTHEFARLIAATDLDATVYALFLTGDTPPTSVSEIRQGVDRGRKRAIALLEAEAESLREALQHAGHMVSGPGVGDKRPTIASDEIFVVHGRDSPAKVEVARLIERAGLKAVILHEQPNAGRIIIEKFEHHGGSAGFAVAVLTPDDVGGNPDEKTLQPRARQNVIGEMFWFAGRLGRQRVCALKKGEIEMPSDFAGVGYVEMDDRGAWKQELLRELQAAGYQVDWSKALA